MTTVLTSVRTLTTPTLPHRRILLIQRTTFLKLYLGIITTLLLINKEFSIFFHRKGTDKHPTLNKKFYKEYETYIKDIFGKSTEIKGPPLASKDPREDFANCLEKTVRNKIKKMTYLHIYFKVIKQ